MEIPKELVEKLRSYSIDVPLSKRLSSFTADEMELILRLAEEAASKRKADRKAKEDIVDFLEEFFEEYGFGN